VAICGGEVPESWRWDHDPASTARHGLPSFSDEVHALSVVSEPRPVAGVRQPDQRGRTIGAGQPLEVDDAVFGCDVVDVVAGRGYGSRQPWNNLAVPRVVDAKAITDLPPREVYAPRTKSSRAITLRQSDMVG
jgi:hypothetical protein